MKDPAPRMAKLSERVEGYSTASRRTDSEAVVGNQERSPVSLRRGPYGLIPRT